MQVAFATGAVVDTSSSESVDVYSLSDDEPYNVTLDRIMQGQSFADSTKVTAVEITAHGYTESDEVMSVYRAVEPDVGNDIFVKFSEPLHSLGITKGEIIDSGTNFAKIHVLDGCELTGKKYTHALSVYRHDYTGVTLTDPDNVVSIPSATLVSADNVAAVLERCVKYYGSRKTVNMKIVESEGFTTKAGDMIKCETEYLGDIQGYITSQSYALVGGILIKDTKLKQV